MIHVNQLEKSFGKLKVLRGVTTAFEQGQVVIVIGPNGSGKTTLIKTILGMVLADKGTVTFNGKDMARDYHYRKQIGYMPQIGRYPENMKIGQVFAMMKDLRKHTGPLDEELLQQYDLPAMFDKPMHTLSGGTRQKVSAALAFLFHPPVLILDEPTAGLDPLAAELLKRKINKTKNEGRSVIVTSHIMSEVEEIGDQLMYLLDGQINFCKTIDALKQETGEDRLGRAIAKIMKEEKHV